MSSNEYRPQTDAPQTGLYEEVNILGTATGVFAFMLAGEALPGAPRGFMWRAMPHLPRRELNKGANQLLQVAEELDASPTRTSLIRLAERLEEMAEAVDG